MIHNAPRIVRQELLDKLDSVEMIIAQRYLASGHWILEEKNE